MPLLGAAVTSTGVSIALIGAGDTVVGISIALVGATMTLISAAAAATLNGAAVLLVGAGISYSSGNDTSHFFSFVFLRGLLILLFCLLREGREGVGRVLTLRRSLRRSCKMF